MLLWGLLFGSIGMGYFFYGRKQEKIVAKYCGIALMLAPYLASNVFWLLGIGAGLLVLPYFVRE